MCGAVISASGIVPIWSNFIAVAVIGFAAQSIIKNEGNYIHATARNLIAVSLGRDLLGIAAIVTLIGFGILNPFSAIAIGVGAALLVSVIISSVAIGMANHPNRIGESNRQ